MFNHLPKSLAESRPEFTSAPFETLREIFHGMIADIYFSSIYCIIDALGECEDPQGKICSRLSSMNIQHDSTIKEMGPVLKMLVSSRPVGGHTQQDLRRFPNWKLQAHEQDLDY